MRDWILRRCFIPSVINNCNLFLYNPQSLFDAARALKADVIITIDGDGQFLAQEIDKITLPILDGRADIVIGYRYNENTEMPSYRKIGAKFFR